MISSSLGLDEFNLPLIAVFLPHSNHKHVYEVEELTVAYIQEALAAYESLPPFLKSESDSMPKLKSGIITKVTGKTHNSFLSKTTGDVFMFYCDQKIELCRNVEEEFMKTIKKYRKVASLYFGKMDIGVNEVEGLEVGTVPKLLFFPRSDHTKQVVFKDEPWE
eukprot:CAMPEP_0202968220 /NCGR_PEP_ID=MMETSP1396-20130829/13437_1 /ASSEMBLY_ACC=CAM_ASM_000872 /TAXON_ID= /ORGANISM="Pseudokeronopsis sp., Strain Brazil" /LENGTH=162 /DNA_ID=CAMNT_0049694281 /DNA_START=806 /DNA_END=1294 /DNA_ORIENTATION=+